MAANWTKKRKKGLKEGRLIKSLLIIRAIISSCLSTMLKFRTRLKLIVFFCGKKEMIFHAFQRKSRHQMPLMLEIGVNYLLFSHGLLIRFITLHFVWEKGPLLFFDAGCHEFLIMEKRNNDFICTFTCRRQFWGDSKKALFLSLRSITAASADTFTLVILIQLNKLKRKSQLRVFSAEHS